MPNVDRTKTVANLPLLKNLSLTLENSVISPYGVKRIQNYLWDLGYPTLPQDWKWDKTLTQEDGDKCQVNGEVYVGSFPKRVSQYLHKNHPQYQKLSNDVLGQIGSLVDQYSLKNSQILFDFTDNFDWEDGNFGDEGSCFWGDRSRVLDIMTEEGFLAIRFYIPLEEREEADTEQCDYNYGMARAWIYPLLLDGQQCFILFNGYGIALSHIAYIFAEFLKASCSTIKLSNNGNCSGLLYINGCKGYIVGPEEVISKHGSYDFGLNTSEYNCCNCDCEIEEDDIYWHNDEVWCSDCYNDTFSCCDDCGDAYPIEENIEVYQFNSSGRSYHIYVCPDCADSSYTECEECGRRYLNDVVLEVEDYGLVCEECRNRGDFYECEECSLIYKKSENKSHLHGGSIMCSGCYEDVLEDEEEEKEIKN